VSRDDHSVFVHLHPSGSISMAALQKFSADAPANHAQHAGTIDGRLEVPYAFPTTGRYRMWVQIKRNGLIQTGSFDIDVP
jgi:hypothetical protein